jgi:hypothetical protein
MNRRRVLVTLNIGLLMVLGLTALGPSASGQREARTRGQYVMVSGKADGSQADAIYIVDSANQDMIVLRWNAQTKSLDGMGFRDLAEDSRLGTGLGR